MNSASQLSNQTTSNEINPDYENVEPKIEQVFLFDNSDFSGCCNEVFKTPSIIKDEIKMENASSEEDIVTGEAITYGFIKTEKPNIVIKSNSGTCDSSNLNSNENQISIKAEIIKSSFEENEPLSYVKEEEMAIDENYIATNEAADGKFFFK